MKNLFCMAALAFVGACIAACSGSEDVANEITPQQPSTGKVLLSGTLSAKDNETRAVDADGHAYWTAGERVYIYYRNTTGGWNEVETSLVGTDIAGNATFSVEVENPQNGGDIKVVYPASCALKNTGTQGFSTTKLFTDQVGTISDISTYWDIAMGQSTMNVSGSTVTITNENVIPMINQLCICKFKLKDESGNSFYATELQINDGSNDYTITPSFAKDEFYVAMLPCENKKITFAATLSGTGFVFTKQDGVTLSNCTSANVGNVFDKDGNLYSVTTGYNSGIYGTTFNNITLEKGKIYSSNLTLIAGGNNIPVGMIAYVGNPGVETGTSYKGLAIAMKDCSSSNTGTDNWKGASPYEAWCDQDDVICASGPGPSTDVSVAREWRDGISKTTELINSSGSGGHNHWAAKSARNYQYDTSNPSATLPSTCSDWFLPSLGQWQLILQGLITKKDNMSEPYSVPMDDMYTDNNKMTTNYLYSITKAAILQSGGYYWTSSEWDHGCTWFANLYRGNASYGNKEGSEYVRAVLAF